MARTATPGLDWAHPGMLEAPLAPETLEEAGLTAGFINDMILKSLYTRGQMLGRDLAQFMCLPFKVIRDCLKFLKDQKSIEVAGGDLVGEVSYVYALTDLGRSRANDAMRACSYVGAAPVPLDDYIEQCSARPSQASVVFPNRSKLRSATLCCAKTCSTRLARPSSAAGPSSFMARRAMARPQLPAPSAIS